VISRFYKVFCNGEQGENHERREALYNAYRAIERVALADAAVVLANAAVALADDAVGDAFQSTTGRPTYTFR
jgi:hypothetical protein